MKIYFIAVITMLAFAGCNQRQADESGTLNNDKLLIATLFHQHAAELSALSYQAYNMAATRLHEIKAANPDPGALAIVLDLDETVLDNSPYQAACILQNFNYPTGWAEWVQLAEAPALPGSADFLNLAVDMGFQVFYISNRREAYRDATKANFIREGIPLQSDAHLILRTEEAGKERRRDIVSENYEIVMLVGDNLSDFHEAFDEQSSSRRLAIADSLRHKFGGKYIVLPNAMYGDWLGTLQNFDYSMSEEQKMQLYYERLKGFNYEVSNQ